MAYGMEVNFGYFSIVVMKYPAIPSNHVLVTFVWGRHPLVILLQS